MAAEIWPEVSEHLYTNTQVRRRDEARRQALDDLRQRINERVPESVDQTVELLRQLLALPQIADLCLEFGWGFRDNGSPARWLLRRGGYFIDSFHGGQWRGRARFPGNAEKAQGPILSFKLTTTGLVHPLGDDAWVQVDPSEHADIVRRFNINDGQIEFLIKQITAV